LGLPLRRARRQRGRRGDEEVHAVRRPDLHRAPRRGRARPGLPAGPAPARAPLRRPGRSRVRRPHAGRRARRRGAAARAGLPAGPPLPAPAPAPRRRRRRRRRARAGNARDLAPALALPRPEALTPMHPALSVILFTTLSGAGYGLLAW